MKGKASPIAGRWRITVGGLDLDMDSDNDDRYGTPDRTEREELHETLGNGKLILRNIDDDDSDGNRDNTDDAVDNATDRNDMAVAVIEIPEAVDLAIYTVELDVSDRTRLQLFKADDTLLVGPTQAGPYTVVQADLTDRKMTIRVEALGQKDAAGGDAANREVVKLTLKKGSITVVEDKCVVRLCDALDTTRYTVEGPVSIPFHDQHKDTRMLCVHPTVGQTHCPLKGANGLVGHDYDNNHQHFLAACEHCSKYPGRDTPCGAPPGQIPACGTTAPGSYLG